MFGPSDEKRPTAVVFFAKNGKRRKQAGEISMDMCRLNG